MERQEREALFEEVESAGASNSATSYDDGADSYEDSQNQDVIEL